jgi:hypothetical protein
LACLFCILKLWSSSHIWRDADAEGNRNELEWSRRMKVELFPPDAEKQPRHWVRHDQAFAMMLGPGSIEWGSKRTALEKFDYVRCDLALCDRHEGEWVGLMNVPHLQLGISDAALMAASSKPNGEVELQPHRKFADSRLGALVTAVHAEMAAGDCDSPSHWLWSKAAARTVIPRRIRARAPAKDQRVGLCEAGRRVKS